MLSSNKLFLSLILLVFLNINSSFAEQVFRRGNYDEPDTLDPQQALAVSDTNILNDMYEGLMTYDNKGQLILGQAQSYTISIDKKTYTFKLRKNLQWSNGKKLKAQDFVNSIRRAVDPKVGSTNCFLLDAIENSKAICSGKLPVDKLGIKVLDHQTIVINLEKPIPYLLDLLTNPTFSPVYLDKSNKPDYSVTNGPFKLQKWVVNSYISLIKNDKYIDASQVKLDKVIFYPINQQSVELNRYRAGDLDYTNKVLFSELEWVKKHLPKELYSKPMLASYYYSFNVTKPPLDNKNLRKALMLAIDKDIIAQKILGGNRSATQNFVPSGISNYRSLDQSNIVNKVNKISQEQKLALAKQYFQSAGYGDNNKLKIQLLFHTNEANKVIATAIASMWKKNLGVETELINQEWKVFLRTRLDRKQTQAIREGWVAQYDDPMTFLSLFASNNVQNASGFSNKIYDNLLERAENTTNSKQRIELLNSAEKILLEETPVIPVYTPEVYHLVKPYVTGFNVDNRDRTYDRYIAINK